MNTETRISLSLAVSLFAANSASHAGSYSNTFDDDPAAGIQIFGAAQFSTDGGVNNSGVLKLTTTDPPAQTGSAILDELDPGEALAAFTANFKVMIGGPSASPAFGFSFVYGEGVNGNFGVDGVGNGLRLDFETVERGNGRTTT